MSRTLSVLFSLSLLLVSSSLAIAQEATPSASRVTRYGHPFAGTWEWHNDLGNQAFSSSISYSVIDEDGSYVEYAASIGVGIAQWQPTGERTAELVVSFQHLASTSGLFAPDYVPAGHEFLPSVRTYWLTIEVDETGNKVTASGHYQVRFSAESVPISDDWVGEAYRMTTQLPAEATPGA